MERCGDDIPELGIHAVEGEIASGRMMVNLRNSQLLESYEG